MLSRLLRSAMPMIKPGLAFLGRQALKTGLQVANDVADGDSFSNSAQRRIPEGIKRFASAANFINQSGSGRNRRKHMKSKVVARKKKRVVTTTYSANGLRTPSVVRVRIERIGHFRGSAHSD